MSANLDFPAFAFGSAFKVASSTALNAPSKLQLCISIVAWPNFQAPVLSVPRHMTPSALLNVGLSALTGFMTHLVALEA